VIRTSISTNVGMIVSSLQLIEFSVRTLAQRDLHRS
jgi:hypothetical protein